jgi:hypothetical protein
MSFPVWFVFNNIPASYVAKENSFSASPWPNGIRPSGWGMQAAVYVCLTVVRGRTTTSEGRGFTE